LFPPPAFVLSPRRPSMAFLACRPNRLRALFLPPNPIFVDLPLLPQGKSVSLVAPGPHDSVAPLPVPFFSSCRVGGAPLLHACPWFVSWFFLRFGVFLNSLWTGTLRRPVFDFTLSLLRKPEMLRMTPTFRTSGLRLDSSPFPFQSHSLMLRTSCKKLSVCFWPFPT